MPSQWWKAALSHSHLQSCHSSFLDPKVLIQSPAQANNFKFPAMASPRRVIFLILVCICLPAHERASGWPQSRSSHNSDAEICHGRSGPCCMQPGGKHLPTALAVGRRQIYHRLAQSALCESVTAPQAVRAIGPLSLRARGLDRASAAATRSARSASQQVLAKLYIAYDRRYGS